MAPPVEPAAHEHAHANNWKDRAREAYRQLQERERLERGVEELARLERQARMLEGLLHRTLGVEVDCTGPTFTLDGVTFGLHYPYESEHRRAVFPVLVILEDCSRCGVTATSDPLKGLTDAGRALTDRSWFTRHPCDANVRAREEEGAA